MALNTMSKFYYGHNVTSSNNKLDFKEGSGPELTATLNVGDYSLTEYVAEMQRAMNAAGALTYAVTVNRSDRIVTVAASGTFSLLAGTGTNIGNGVWSMAGYNAADQNGISLQSNNATGSEFKPQFFLQRYISFDDQESASYSSVAKAAGGTVEVVSFGTENFMNAEIAYQTNITQQTGSIVEDQTNGLDNLRTFMQYITAKRKIEFMPDRDTVGTYTKCLLESTPSSGDGTGFVLNEYLGSLPGFFSTGTLRFRKVT